ncbi:hypothetical protein WICPIJ_003988 [Wickerhamomyces pijperi]|uniref:Cell division control protein 73 C-terminal domain-containing protein n=1 Tax=Wickerhamomyces pijperi TaxID=599730 RepID=A0A9P8TN76_WICPI|nr:hypothetical protein WICPIJ_003988 [Wickerhamomyces pijperi]
MTSAADILSLLKKHLTTVNKEGQLTLLTSDNSNTTDIQDSKYLKLSNEEVLPLDSETDFVVNDKKISLRVVTYCWLYRDLPTTEFIAKAQEDNITEILTFGQRLDLTQWLAGEKDQSDNISTGDSAKTSTSLDTTTASTSAVANSNDSFLKAVLSHERDLYDHNATLRGTKPISFSNTSKECEIRIVKPLKRKHASSAKPSSSSSSTSASTSTTTSTSSSISAPADSKRKKTVTPVILISPAASSLLNLKNITAFLEHAKFIPPTAPLDTLSVSDQTLLRETATDANLKNITHTFPKLGPLKIHITDSTSMFTRSEHWDRVVAVVTTGQEWQFKPYKWSTGVELFRHVKGFYFQYEGDKIPENVKNWGNVDVVGVERLRRFKDSESAGKFWDSLEKVLISKGYK